MSEAGSGTHESNVPSLVTASQDQPPSDGAQERERRLAELRRQCENGTYRVDAAKLSVRLIDEHLER